MSSSTDVPGPDAPPGPGDDAEPRPAPDLPVDEPAAGHDGAPRSDVTTDDGPAPSHRERLLLALLGPRRRALGAPARGRVGGGVLCYRDRDAHVSLGKHGRAALGCT